MRYVIICAILFFSFQICLSQENKRNLLLLDSIDQPNCEHLLARLDNLAIETLSKSQLQTAYVIIYGGNDPIVNKFYELSVKSYLKTRKLDENRFAIMTAKASEKIRIELWKSKNEAKPRLDEVKFDYLLTDLSKPVLFVQDTVEVADIDGELTYFLGGCAVCCIKTLSLSVLAKFLEANPKINAQFVIKNKTKKGAEILAKLILSEAEKDYKIPRNRLKIKYGGKGQWDIADEYYNKLSDIEVWLVPQKKK